MLALSESKAFRTLTQSEELIRVYTNARNSGFLGDPDPKYGFVNYPKLIEHFQIVNPLEWFGSRDTELLINFMNTLVRDHKTKISTNGWRLSFAAFLNFWIMFENREALEVCFLTDELNWDKDLAELFLDTAKKFS
jgi:hypothetical protein